MSRWLVKRGKVWHYRFRVNGVTHTGSTRATDRATALQVLEVARREIVLGEHGIRKSPTLGAVADEWIATRGRAVSPAHLRAARQSLDALESLRKLPLSHLSTARVDDWLARFLEDHSPASGNLVLRYLRLWCRWAMGQGFLKEMPYQTKPVRAQQRERAIVPLGQVDEWLEAIGAKCRNPQIPAALRFAMMLGLRESEVLQARWEWLRDGCFTVGGKTKSKRIRVVPVPEPLRVALLHMLAAVQRGPAQVPHLGLIFPGPKGKPHTSTWLRQALRRSPIKGVTMHRLRATFATLHLRAGTPLKEVQAMLGHADPRTTLIYQEVSREEQTKRQSALWG